MLKTCLNNLSPAPTPQPDTILQVRTGKVKTNTLTNAQGPEPSAIDKSLHKTPVLVASSGLLGDERAYVPHRVPDRAVHQYSSTNYLLWQKEYPALAGRFSEGAFGENFVAHKLTEENVCVGDVFRVGEEGREILLEVSEPRNPCYKLNLRFRWDKALRTIGRKGRVGWNMRVLKEGYVTAGDVMTLVERPYPKWSIINVQRVIRQREVDPTLMEELAGLNVVTKEVRDRAIKRLATASRTYGLVKARAITRRVRELTFELKNLSQSIMDPEFRPFAHVQIKFGSGRHTLSRSYSVVDGNRYKFSLGIALDDNSRGGSRYLHKSLRIGDEISMTPGSSEDTAFTELSTSCLASYRIEKRILIIGGIGVTAFLRLIKTWQTDSIPFEIHYAVRSIEEAAYREELPPEYTTIYARSRHERLDVQNIIPFHDHNTKMYCCGPASLMKDCRRRTSELGYPEQLLHFETFIPVGEMGDPFNVEVDEKENGRKETLHVPSDKSLLQVLTNAGFDVMTGCQKGSCAICTVDLCEGQAIYKSKIDVSEKGTALRCCVDRGRGKIKIEID